MLTDNSLVSSVLGWESQAVRESREGMSVIQEVATTLLREKLEQLGDTGENEKVRHYLVFNVDSYSIKEKPGVHRLRR